MATDRTFNLLTFIKPKNTLISYRSSLLRPALQTQLSVFTKEQSHDV